MLVVRHVALLGLFAAVVSCTEPQRPSGDVCATSGAEARTRVERVVNESLVCATDADCFTVPFSAGCFDSCTVNVNLAGKTAVDRAEALVEAGECKTFEEAGCKLEHPPCAPPSPPTCISGRCQ